MKTDVKLVIFLFAAVLVACEKDKPEGGDVNLKSGEMLVGYWGGSVDYQWKILSLGNNTLKIAWLK